MDQITTDSRLYCRTVISRAMAITKLRGAIVAAVLCVLYTMPGAAQSWPSLPIGAPFDYQIGGAYDPPAGTLVRNQLLLSIPYQHNILVLCVPVYCTGTICNFSVSDFRGLVVHFRGRRYRLNIWCGPICSAAAAFCE